ncbi:ribonuclease H-like domain-containing protein [Tanacetum coccineum]
MSPTNALKAKLCSTKLGDQSMKSYFQKIESISTILTSLDSHVDDEDFVHYALEGLPNKYDQVCGYVHRKDTFPDLKTGRSMLITEEMRLKSKALASLMDSLSSSPMVLLAKSDNNHRPSTTPQVNLAVEFHTSPSTNTSPPAVLITTYPSSFSLPTHVPSYHFAAAMSPAQAQYVQSTQLGIDTAYLLLYVDDIVLTASSKILLQVILSLEEIDVEILDKAHMVNCNLSRTPVDTESKLGSDGDSVFDPTLYRSLAGWLHISDANWAGVPTSRHSTFRFTVFSCNNLTLWFSKPSRRFRPECRGRVVVVVCHAVRGDFCSIFIVANLVQHQRMKHIEIDIQFVRDLVAAGQFERPLSSRSNCGGHPQW